MAPLPLLPGDEPRLFHQSKRARERGAIHGRQISKLAHRRAGMLLQHSQDPPTGAVEAVGTQLRIDRPRASREDLTEIEKEMILKLESSGRSFVRSVRASLQSSSLAPARRN